MNTYNEIIERIKVLRKARKITQEQLADGIGLTRTSVNNIEKGRQRITIKTLIKISEFFGVELYSIIPMPETKEDKILHSFIEKLKQRIKADTLHLSFLEQHDFKRESQYVNDRLEIFNLITKEIELVMMDYKNIDDVQF